MNAVEIEEAISALAELPFDGGDFPFAFLQAFGNKDATIKRLRAGSTNASDLPGGVLQRSNIHIAVAAPGAVTQTLAALRASPATAKAKARFILATDGDGFEAEELESGETVACAYLERTVDGEDRRKLTVTLTARGQAAAAAQAGAREKIDAALLARIGPEDVRRTRAALWALIDIGRSGKEHHH